MNISNWKLVELKGKYRIVSEDYKQYLSDIFDLLNLPEKYNEHINRSESFINWGLMPVHENFFFDYVGNEELGETYKASRLKEYREIIVTYIHVGIVVAFDIDTFFNEWDDIFNSTHYNALLLSPDYKLIMEITRDYYLHSNFLIKP